MSFSLRSVRLAGILVLCAGSLLHAWRGFGSRERFGHALGIDDAFISFRYAAHLRADDGLVFNVGERVEGYSNLLFTLLLSPFAEGEPTLRLWRIAIGLGLLAAIWVLWQLPQLLDVSTAASSHRWMLLLWAFCPQLWLWVASGMETACFCAIQFAIWLCVVQWERSDRAGTRWRLVLALGAAICMRADGFVSAGIALAYVFWRRRAALFWAGAPLICLLGALFLWRFAYYGAWLPNTYHAKVTGGIAARVGTALPMLADILIDEGLLPHLLALLLLAWSQRKAKLSFAPYFALALLAYWIYVGGDNMRARFLLILYPMGAWALITLLEGHRRRRNFVLACALAMQLHALVSDKRFDYRQPHYDHWVELGRFLRREHPDATLAIDAAGKVPWFSQLHCIDMLGLNDAHIARTESRRFVPGHSKHDAAYVLSRQPDLIATWATGRSAPPDLAFGLSRELYEPAGYRPRYFVSRPPQPAGRPSILDLWGAPTADIEQALRSGYSYVVLQREGAWARSDSLPTGH